MLIQISSGQGPVECSVGVEKLCKAFLKEFTGSRIVSVNEDYSGNGYKSCVMEFDEDVSMLEGTVLWVWKSTIRPGHQRKNWYMDVSVIKEAEARCTAEERAGSTSTKLRQACASYTSRRGSLLHVRKSAARCRTNRRR